jgi:hypothetical protein
MAVLLFLPPSELPSMFQLQPEEEHPFLLAPGKRTGRRDPVFALVESGKELRSGGYLGTSEPGKRILPSCPATVDGRRAIHGTP